jgi:D-alanine-D-alanine ligase
VIGNRRLQTLPVWELIFKNLPEGAPRIATSKVKWDLEYQQRYGITSGAARNLTDELRHQLARISKRVFRLLNLSGYARMDFRLTEDGRAFLLEPNPNPQLEYGEDFAEAAHAAGLHYLELLQRILNLGRRYHQ